MVTEYYILESECLGIMRTVWILFKSKAIERTESVQLRERPKNNKNTT